MSTSELALKAQNCPNKLLERLFSGVGERADLDQKDFILSLPLTFYVATILHLFLSSVTLYIKYPSYFLWLLEKIYLNAPTKKSDI